MKAPFRTLSCTLLLSPFNSAIRRSILSSSILVFATATSDVEATAMVCVTMAQAFEYGGGPFIFLGHL